MLQIYMLLVVYSMIYKEYYFVIRSGTSKCRMVIKSLSTVITCTTGIHDQVLIDALEHLGQHLVDIGISVRAYLFLQTCNWVSIDTYESVLTSLFVDILSIECWSGHWSSVDWVSANHRSRCPSSVDQSTVHQWTLDHGCL